MRRRTLLLLAAGAALALALIAAPEALAAAGGGSSGFSGGGGEGGGGGGRGAALYFLIQILIRIAIIGHGLGALILIGLLVLWILFTRVAPRLAASPKNLSYSLRPRRWRRASSLTATKWM